MGFDSMISPFILFLWGKEEVSFDL